jgi:hemerythrin-like domain-containing protein
MSNLISELKKQHVGINSLLSCVYDCISTNEKKIDFVLRLKHLMTEHIEKEKNELYPFLIKEAETDNSLKFKLETYSNEMNEIENFLNYYNEKYGNGNFDGKFTSDTAHLISILKQRILKEELSIFSEYEKRI